MRKRYLVEVERCRAAGGRRAGGRRRRQASPVRGGHSHGVVSAQNGTSRAPVNPADREDAAASVLPRQVADVTQTAVPSQLR